VAPLALLVACEAGPVTWEKPTTAEAVLLPEAHLVIDQAGRAGVTTRWTAPLSPAGDRCAGTLVTVRARGDTAWASWWAPVGTKGMQLLLARSDDEGLNWRDPVPVAPADEQGAWCGRAIPAMAVDSASGTVHLAYSVPVGTRWATRLVARQGDTFGTPVEIVQDDSIAAAGVAASGDRVVVAYSTWDGKRSTVRLALVAQKGQIPVVRSDVPGATVLLSPPLVAAHGTRVAVAWNEDADGRERPRAVVRMGSIR
jgi:hypothetical protein